MPPRGPPHLATHPQPAPRLGPSTGHHLADRALAAPGSSASTPTPSSTAPEPDPAVAGDGPLLGALFGSLATLSARVHARADRATVGHLRTRAGQHEIDSIIEPGDGRVGALGVELACDVDAAALRHLRWLRDQIGPGSSWFGPGPGGRLAA